MWSDWIVSCDRGFQSVCPLMEKGKRFVEASWWEKLTEWETLVLTGVAMLSKSLIQFSVDGWGCVPSLIFTWGQTMVKAMKMWGTPSKGPMHALPHSVTPAAGHRWPRPPLETPVHLQASLGQSLVGSLLLSPWMHKYEVIANMLFNNFYLRT